MADPAPHLVRAAPPLLQRVDVSNQRNARFCAVFDDGTQVHFGRKSQQYYTGGHYDPRRRQEFLYRHRGDTWDDPVDPRTLERWLLWECNHLDQAVALYNKRFAALMARQSPHGTAA